ncbi:concanavalin A-like lectin/glucanase domain-containing protein [Cantharellus anzutake]|uniref:concanavalin A-like lectin/glucanase domain-containing protein n=1 Tax=Cantharellus anzutake TaxID=1750568 RepID=UPI00190746D2|nr:concanavalin A-like lectin/glucanase domain-containing protein [Cantharellus anzutake]KAF8312888.1 concanavalin A-like lectin/glucanase domain-containing protein [Cantharellus anzutake]
MGSTFAGLENGDQCFCGNTISWTGGNAQPVADSECSTPCPLLNIGTCGGTNRIEIYASPSYALSSPWDLKQNYEGPTFFDEWEFFTRSDPTHGAVNYNNAAYSWSKGLVSINGAGNAIMRVDTTPNITSNRDSVRISTIMHYDGGLVILDAVHMPVGCGTWPAFWSLGTPTWPVDGEIDIVEGVHFAQQNLMSIHTENGCTMPIDFGGTGTLTGSPNCDAHANSNTGCGIRASGPNTYGEGFNSNGGGVYAMIWDDASGGEGIRIWFFPRGSVPFDVSTGEPQPSGWGTPQARWPSTSCNPPDFFKSHMLVFDTTLCGDWAGAADIWSSPVNNGQVGGSCATRTGYSTCVDYIRARGEDFTNAYWEVKSVKLYQ